jgi:putative ABC transport system ATP-binding protein
LLQGLVRTHSITLALVTHEPDVAECATRVISVRDGRIERDEVNPAPRDAGRALAEEPPP